MSIKRERGTFTVSIMLLEDKEYNYAVFNDKEGLYSNDALYMCRDGGLRRWSSCVEEYGRAGANASILHGTTEELEVAIKAFELANPEYYI